MKTTLRTILMFVFVLFIVGRTQKSLFAADFKREVIYQIITDRFFDGSASNNDPPQSAGLYDPTKTNWRAYWGGDLPGIQQRMSYLAGMGVTAIWISPPVDNLNTNIPDANGNPTASYQGYQARDFKRIEEHFGNPNNTWTEFDNLVTAAHQNGIKVIIDFAPNNSTQNNAGEFGALYDNGTFLGNFTNDSNGYFHHNPNISGSGWDDRYQVQYYTLFDLADINQEHATMDAYLKAAARLFQQHGVDGFRIDAMKHLTWGWGYSLANSIYTFDDSFLFGEWFQGNTSDPLYRDSFKFASKSGISLLDFPLNTAIRNVFGSNADFSAIDSVIAQEGNDFAWKEDLVTFIDNHEMARFLSINNNNNRLHQAIAFTLTSRGIPCIYYGTEQYLHNDTGGGTDPYNRPMMSSFSTSTIAYQLINRLSSLRRNNPAIPYGSMGQRWINKDVYIYERKFFESVVLVAINKSETSSYNVSSLNTSLPAGNYSDYLNGLLGGLSITVSSGSDNNNRVTNFRLPAHTVSVWQFTEGAASPQIGSIGPTTGQPGIKVVVAGNNFGTKTGTVKFGATTATVNSWSPTQITVTTPSVVNANYNVTVTNSGGQVSNAIQYTLLAANLIPIKFTVNNASPTEVGDYIFLTGNTVELGNWSASFDSAVGPMLPPNYPNWFIVASVPAGQTILFKFIKIAANSAVTWEAGSNHQYTVPTSGTGFVSVNWQYGGEGQSQPLSSNSTATSMPSRESAGPVGPTSEIRNLEEFDKLPIREKENVLSQDGPLLPPSYNMEDIQMRVFVHGGWPLAISYSLSRGASARLTVATDATEPLIQQLDTGENKDVVIRIPDRFGEAPRVAKIHIRTTVQARHSTSAPFMMHSIGIALEENEGNAGPLAALQSNFPVSKLPSDALMNHLLLNTWTQNRTSPISNVILQPAAIRTSQREDLTYSFVAKTFYRGGAAEFFLYELNPQGELIPELVFRQGIKPLRQGEGVSGRWDGRKSSGEFSYGVHRLGIRMWRELAAGAKWYGLICDPQVTVSR